MTNLGGSYMSKQYRQEKSANENYLIDCLMKDMPSFIRGYRTSMKAQSLSTNTQLVYMREIRSYMTSLASELELQALDEITPNTLELASKEFIENYISDIAQKYSDNRKNTDPADKTKLHRLDCIRSLYSYLYKAELITRNPTVFVDTPKVKRKEISFLTPADIQTLFDAIKTANTKTLNTQFFKEKAYFRDMAIMTVLLGTGMRVSELVGLNIEDFDTNNSCFHVIRKGGDEDTVSFGSSVEKAVKEYIDLSRSLFHPIANEKALFLSTRGTRLTARSVELLVKKYANVAGLSSDLHPHSMRASFATNVYNQTKDIYAVKNALHHASLETSKHYIGDEAKSKKLAANAMDTIL